MWWKKFKGGSQCAAYIKSLQKLQDSGFSRFVYVGETKISESLITGETSSPLAALRDRHTWNVIHAGRERGWVPWNYKLFLHSTDSFPKPKKDTFQELCSELSAHYGKCAIIVNPQMRCGRIPHHFPMAPVQLLSMSCSPEEAQSYGHALLQIPYYCANLSPLNSAWSTVKGFISNHRSDYSEEACDRYSSHKCIFLPELIDDALKTMTRQKWECATARVLENENLYLNQYQ
ncbi:uncharacterized protein C21orf140-like [Salminus brasiliensis]|uniref:uncharacterized protein C21orf140-like n=1 Tax=Salminus brasiliensis TaxID=930266 RepID=UPI003B8346E2